MSIQGVDCIHGDVLCSVFSFFFTFVTSHPCLLDNPEFRICLVQFSEVVYSILKQENDLESFLYGFSLMPVWLQATFRSIKQEKHV